MPVFVEQLVFIFGVCYGHHDVVPRGQKCIFWTLWSIYEKLVVNILLMNLLITHPGPKVPRDPKYFVCDLLMLRIWLFVTLYQKLVYTVPVLQ